MPRPEADSERPLMPRQLEVLELMAKGLTNRELRVGDHRGPGRNEPDRGSDGAQRARSVQILGRAARGRRGGARLVSCGRLRRSPGDRGAAFRRLECAGGVQPSGRRTGRGPDHAYDGRDPRRRGAPRDLGRPPDALRGRRCGRGRQQPRPLRGGGLGSLEGRLARLQRHPAVTIPSERHPSFRNTGRSTGTSPRGRAPGSPKPSTSTAAPPRPRWIVECTSYSLPTGP
jgi:hypothetical protein